MTRIAVLKYVEHLYDDRLNTLYERLSNITDENEYYSVQAEIDDAEMCKMETLYELSHPETFLSGDWCEVYEE